MFNCLIGLLITSLILKSCLVVSINNAFSYHPYSLLLRRECCSFSNGEYVKAGLAELEHWCYNATDEYAGSSWDELKHIRQAIGFLVHFHDLLVNLKSQSLSGFIKMQ